MPDRALGVRALPARAAIAGLRAYKLLLSPLYAGSCRYLPSCSDYCADAVRVHGVVKGLALGAWRLMRCNPLGGHGLDPVPPRRTSESSSRGHSAATAVRTNQR